MFDTFNINAKRNPIAENEFANVTVLATLVAVSGIIGNIVGYWFGAKSGQFLYNKEDSFFFKKK